jgi:glutamate-5-semialdehyde dehydrogenase
MLVKQKERVKNYRISSVQKDQVLNSMSQLLDQNRDKLISINKKDLDAHQGTDKAMYDRLIINEDKIDGMIKAVHQVMEKEDPVGKELYSFQHPKGMKISNITDPFGSILIIYESRPDVTIEAAVIAFKAGNAVLLKGGKEAIHSNLALVNLWHKALQSCGLSTEWIKYLDFNRQQTQAFLSSPELDADLIIPRGGEGLIRFVKQNTNVPVLVSGRGNNFIFIHKDADWTKTLDIILNAKTDKISACNALDKVLIDKSLPNLSERTLELASKLNFAGVELLVSEEISEILGDQLTYLAISTDNIWKEEFLALKIAIGFIPDTDQAIEFINEHSGGHSVSIITEDNEKALAFMSTIDAAAVYQNCSTRFTDGGEFGLGAEMAISTDKLHHRGPLGLEQLVSNKWYVFGNGQTR